MRLFLLSVLLLFGKRIFGRGSLIYGNGPGSQSSLVAVLAEYHFRRSQVSSFLRVLSCPSFCLSFLCRRCGKDSRGTTYCFFFLFIFFFRSFHFGNFFSFPFLNLFGDIQ